MGADRVETVERAPVFVCVVQLGAGDLIVRGALLDALCEEEARGVGCLVEVVFGAGHLLALGKGAAALEKLAVSGDGAVEESGQLFGGGELVEDVAVEVRLVEGGVEWNGEPASEVS